MRVLCAHVFSLHVFAAPLGEKGNANFELGILAQAFWLRPLVLLGAGLGN